MKRSVGVLAVTLTLAALGGVTYELRHVFRPQPPCQQQPVDFTQYCRARFLREHPGAETLNMRIGRAAIRLHDEQPMGRFVLGVNALDIGNDCSDFVKCAMDEGVGVKARFRRNSEQHLIGGNPRYFEMIVWDHKASLLPGDGLAVAHSPWYEPYDGACWHVGIVGADGLVYDFVKLKSWPKPRYGRNTVQWFVHNSKGDDEIVIERLRPEYRYLVKKIGE